MQQPPTKIIYKTLSSQIKDNLQGVICVYAYTLENQNIFCIFPRQAIFTILCLL